MKFFGWGATPLELAEYQLAKAEINRMEAAGHLESAQANLQAFNLRVNRLGKEIARLKKAEVEAQEGGQS